MWLQIFHLLTTSFGRNRVFNWKISGKIENIRETSSTTLIRNHKMLILCTLVDFNSNKITFQCDKVRRFFTVFFNS